MAYGIAKLVAQQYHKSHPNFTNFMITGVIGFGGFHHSIVKY
jgi:hypothetical protein